VLDAPSLGRRCSALLSAVLLALSCSCSSDRNDGAQSAASAGGGGQTAGAAGQPSPGDAGSRGGGGTGTVIDPDAVIGAFKISLIAEVPETDGVAAVPAHTSLLGRVYDAPVPGAISWRLSGEQGACQLFVPEAPFCDPNCGNDAVCVSGGVCEPYPSALDLGVVTVRGLTTTAGEAEFSMTPLPPSNVYQPRASVDLAYPPCAEGDAVELSTAGKDLAAFELETAGILPLQLLGGRVLPFERGQATTVEWARPGQPSLTTISVSVDISHHGGQKGEIRCEVADDGSLEIPAELVTQLIELGVSGFPALQVVRRAIGSTSTEQGKVEFSIESSRTLELAIPGLSSCENVGDSSECPAGQVCQQDLKCK
jgi:hypothetical protein